MRLAILTPSYLPTIRGNAITAARLAAGLAERGATVEVLALDRAPGGEILAGLRAFRPEILHGLHATASGPLLLEAAGALGVPAVLTLTGTDANQDLFHPERRPLVCRVLREVQAVVAFHDVIRDKVRRELPECAPRLHVIGQGVRWEGAPPPPPPPRLPGEFVFLQVAGIRRVKNIPAVIPPLTALQRSHSGLRYRLAGPVLEAAEGERVAGLLASRPWAAHLGPLPHAALRGLLAGSDALLSSSLSEGGMPNAVLEAMSLGVPVLASDIEGHRSVVADGETGLLYGSEAECLAQGERLIADDRLRARLGARARERAAEQFSPAAEIERHLALYRRLLSGEGGA